ncbi:MAG TPA: ChbG/HpnK family deacetylase, partial [Gaiellaceae bacterium]|nr:ChbG/HpnK family deacetylase [Gaiellaceae bacterium]
MIVNADDFGLSPTVNRAVVDAFQRGLVSSATVMPNMPGFDEACALAGERGLQQHVGTHLVLTAGAPLTDRLRRSGRFCDDEGRFRGHRDRGRVLRLDREERSALAGELRKQIEACRRAGLPVTHVDSHQHIHTEPGILRVVVAVTRELGVPYVRLARNCRPAVPRSTRVYRAVVNARLRWEGLAATRYFGDIDDYLALRNAGAASAALRDLELMTHPA